MDALERHANDVTVSELDHDCIIFDMMCQFVILSCLLWYSLSLLLNKLHYGYSCLWLWIPKLFFKYNICTLSKLQNKPCTCMTRHDIFLYSFSFSGVRLFFNLIVHTMWKNLNRLTELKTGLVATRNYFYPHDLWKTSIKMHNQQEFTDKLDVTLANLQRKSEV